jgi:hypothetical protein
MKSIALLTPDAGNGICSFTYFKPFLTPRGDSCLDGYQFVLNPTEGQFDGLVVPQSIGALSRTYVLNVPPTRTLLVYMEPPNFLTLPDAYTMQFEAVLSQSKMVKAKKRIFSHSGHHWFVEIPYDDLLTKTPPKNKLISAVISNKSDSPAHRQRFQFMRQIKAHFGDRLDWMGRGVADTGNNKLVGLADYKYHIVIENGQWDHYWSEKLADSYAANCFPFYWGAGNVGEYFSDASMIKIDIFDVNKSISVIERAINDEIFERSQVALQQSRELMIEKYHPYRVYTKIFESLPPSAPSKVVIRPQNEFRYSMRQRVYSRLGLLGVS